jgi:hypothetical protein
MNKADALSNAHRASVTTRDARPVKPCPKKAWIEIVLEDESGKPVPDEEYLITAPDGTDHAGFLDRNGFARVDAIDPGQCRISFPRLDNREWRPK